MIRHVSAHGRDGGSQWPPRRDARASQPLWQRQHDFASAILDPERPPPPGLVGPDGETSARRFAIYRNNVVIGLCETLKASFPAVLRLVGEDFFFAMARIHVAEEPPRSPMMFDYGAGLPDFLDRFPPLAELPYLGDVARIERAWIESYHAAEACPMEAEIFRAFMPEELSRLRLELHPSLRLVRSRFPALTIWRTNIAGDTDILDLDTGGEDALVLRPDSEVEVRSLPPGGYEFVRSLEEGLPVVAALDGALAADRHFDLAATLSGLIGAGAFVGLRAGAPPHPALYGSPL